MLPVTAVNELDFVRYLTLYCILGGETCQEKPTDCQFVNMPKAAKYYNHYYTCVYSSVISATRDWYLKDNFSLILSIVLRQYCTRQNKMLEQSDEWSDKQ